VGWFSFSCDVFEIKTEKKKTQSWILGGTPFGFGLVCVICLGRICVFLIQKGKGWLLFLQSVPIRVAGRTSEAWTLHASASHMQPPPKSRSFLVCGSIPYCFCTLVVYGSMLDVCVCQIVSQTFYLCQ